MGIRMTSMMDGFIGELELALESTQQQMRGHTDLLASQLSDTAKQPITAELESDTRRAGLIEDALRALGALKKDGYPDDPTVTVPPEVYREYQAELNAILASLNDFESGATPPAENVTIHLGEPADKPQGDQ